MSKHEEWRKAGRAMPLGDGFSKLEDALREKVPL